MHSSEVLAFISEAYWSEESFNENRLYYHINLTRALNECKSWHRCPCVEAPPLINWSHCWSMGVTTTHQWEPPLRSIGTTAICQWEPPLFVNGNNHHLSIGTTALVNGSHRVWSIGATAMVNESHRHWSIREGWISGYTLICLAINRILYWRMI